MQRGDGKKSINTGGKLLNSRVNIITDSDVIRYGIFSKINKQCLTSRFMSFIKFMDPSLGFGLVLFTHLGSKQ